MNKNFKERLDYYRTIKFMPVLLIVIGAFSSIPLCFPGIITISNDHAWITASLNLFIPILITCGLVSIFLESYGTYQYFKKHISNTLISSSYLENLNPKKRSELRNTLLSDTFLSDFSVDDLFKIRISLMKCAFNIRSYTRIDDEFFRKIEETTSNIVSGESYIRNYEMSIHFHEETVNGVTYMRKIINRKIEYFNVTEKNLTIGIMKARRFVKINDIDFFRIQCFIIDDKKKKVNLAVNLIETSIEKESSIYNVKTTSKDIIELKPGETIYNEETSTLLPLNDKIMIVRMPCLCKSIRIDFIYDGSTPKDLSCWAFCPNAAGHSESKNFTQNHLQLTVEGPLFEGEGVVFLYQDKL